MQDLYHQPYPYLTRVFGSTERPIWPLLKAYSQIEANDGGKPPQCRAAPARSGEGAEHGTTSETVCKHRRGGYFLGGSSCIYEATSKTACACAGYVGARPDTHTHTHFYTLESFSCLLASRWAVLEACIPFTGIACASHPCRRSVLCVATRYARSCHLHYETSHDHTQMHLPTKLHPKEHEVHAVLPETR